MLQCVTETLIEPIQATVDTRLAQLKDWIASIDVVTGAKLVPASADASFRRYFRLQKAAKSFIAMDAPPPNEDCRPFVAVAGFLRDMQLTAPRVIEADLENGFLLLSDLGEQQYLEQLEALPQSANSLYADAIGALLRMQEHGVDQCSELPPYDEQLLRSELALFRDWLCDTHLRLPLSQTDEQQWQSCCDLLVDNALQQPQVFVHRDYHSRNLMVVGHDNPGILDFQDAVEGPLTYDLVSLLKDCYITWPAFRVRSWAADFYTGLDDAMREQVDEEQFVRFFELMGVQRHLKAAGIFCRLNHRDGKPAYLPDIPRALTYIVDLKSRYAELDFLIQLLEERVLPRWCNAK